MNVSPDHGNAQDFARRGLTRVAERMRSMGVPVPGLEGKLLRPLFALAMIPRDRWATIDDRFWFGALAIQMVHEASLLHDDVLDNAGERRGAATVAAAQGTAAAVVLGDHYLTGAYRAASATSSFEFVSRFAEAVERTVAGEVAQGRAVGRTVSLQEYSEAISGKSGELFGAAGVLGGTVAGLGDAETRRCIGMAFGILYQKIDDLLDYCPTAETGKPPFQDFRQKKWSWILGLAAIDSFDESEADLTRKIFDRSAGSPSAARKALELLRDRGRHLLTQGRRVGVCYETLEEIVRGCLEAAEGSVSREERRGVGPVQSPVSGDGQPFRDSQGAFIRGLADRLAAPQAWATYFGEHARTFHLAARLFPPREAALVSGLYAYCRFTDDLVDDPADRPGPDVLAVRLSIWREWSLAAFDGEATGVVLLDTVLGDAAKRGVGRHYPEALLDGVAMDLVPRRYEDWAELERYTFGVAGAVGGWMTQLFGTDDPALLERAHALGDAMQLTNIARDVGEDLRSGRLYLPTELLSAHGLTRSDLEAMATGDVPVSDAYKACIAELIARSERSYDMAWPGIRALPSCFRRPVAAAAAAYRGIHREIRLNGYDNLSMRAHTSTARKLMLAGAGLARARL